MTEPSFEAIVIGGGPVGLTAALALGHCGIATAIVVPLHSVPGSPAGERTPAATTAPPLPDTRTAALMSGSLMLLDNLGVWAALAPACAPLTAIRIIDATGRIPRAPEVLFRASEIGIPAFGHNVPHAPLLAALHRAVAESSRVTAIASAGVTAITTGDQGARVTLGEGGSLSGRLVVGADGRGSLSRAAAGIAIEAKAYPQTALTCAFAHGRPHGNISTEFHTAQGPVTTVPLPGLASSLVWVEAPSTAGRLKALDDTAFRAALEARLGGLLGRIGALSPRSLYPLSHMIAERFAANRIALTGEAAHVIAPIGAQGLNLGLRDASALADVMRAARARFEDLGHPAVLEAYDAGRRKDTRTRAFAVDLLNTSLLAGAFPIHFGRGFGLAALKVFAPLRERAMREGLQPSHDLPSLMRERVITAGTTVA